MLTTEELKSISAPPDCLIPKFAPKSFNLVQILQKRQPNDRPTTLKELDCVLVKKLINRSDEIAYIARVLPIAEREWFLLEYLGISFIKQRIKLDLQQHSSRDEVTSCYLEDQAYILAHFIELFPENKRFNFLLKTLEIKLIKSVLNSEGANIITIAKALTGQDRKEFLTNTVEPPFLRKIILTYILSAKGIDTASYIAEVANLFPKSERANFLLEYLGIFLIKLVTGGRNITTITATFSNKDETDNFLQQFKQNSTFIDNNDPRRLISSYINSQKQKQATHFATIIKLLPEANRYDFLHNELGISFTNRMLNLDDRARIITLNIIIETLPNGNQQTQLLDSLRKQQMTQPGYFATTTATGNHQEKRSSVADIFSAKMNVF